MKNHVINPARPKTRGPVSGAIGKSRYSNWYGGAGSDVFTDLGTTGDYSDVNTHQTYNADGTLQSGSGWTAQNTVDTINTSANFLQNVLTAIFGRNNIQQSQYATELYRQEQRTNTILWVVLGLVLALGVVLVIRKTK